MRRFPLSVSQTTSADAISYEQAVVLVQNWLKTFPFGQLKRFAQTGNAGLNYAGLINLKNNKLLRAAPQAIQCLLYMMGIATEVHRARDKDTQRTIHQYLFKKKSGLRAFNEACQRYAPSTNLSTPVASQEEFIHYGVLGEVVGFKRTPS